MIETVFRLCRKAVLYLRDTPGKQPPCLHEQIFSGQRTASGISRELPGYHGDRMGKESSLSDPEMSYFLAKFVKRGIIRGEFLCYDEDIPAGPEGVYGF